MFPMFHESGLNAIFSIYDKNNVFPDFPQQQPIKTMEEEVDKRFRNFWFPDEKTNGFRRTFGLESDQQKGGALHSWARFFYAQEKKRLTITSITGTQVRCVDKM